MNDNEYKPLETSTIEIGKISQISMNILEEPFKKIIFSTYYYHSYILE